MAVSKLDTAVPTESCLPLYLIAVSSHFITINKENCLSTVRSDSGGEFNILGGDVSDIVRKDVYVNVCISQWLQRLMYFKLQT